MKNVRPFRRSIIETAFLILLFVIFSLPSNGQTLSPIKLSDNKRFLVKSDGKPFFYMGDTAWELFHRLNRDQAIQYLDNRANNKFTVIQAVAIAELDGLNTPNAHGDKPFLNNNPATPDVTSGSNPGNATEYDYWDHVDFIINEAAKRGIYIALLPTWGNWVNESPIFNLSNARTYGQFLGNRYGNKSLIWVIGGDRNPNTQYQVDIWRTMAEGVRAGSGKSHSDLLMTFHTQGVYSSSRWFHNDEWLDFSMWQTGHCDGFNVSDRIAEDYRRSPTKPVIDGESMYEDHPICFSPDSRGYSKDTEVRKRAYWAVFAGALGHTYGNHSIWQMHDAGRRGINFPIKTWSQALYSPGGTQMKHLRTLMESRPYLSRVPDQSIISGDAGGENNRIQATRGDGYAFVYFPLGQNVSINLGKISGSTVKAWWYDTRTGNSSLLGTYANSGTRQFDPPGSQSSSNDWVLVLDDAGRNFPAPGNGIAPVVTDTQSPSAPANLVSTGKTHNSVNLSWGASWDNTAVAGYDVYNGSAKVNSSLVTGTSFTVANLSANTAYSFTVMAKDGAGNTSGASNNISVTTNTAPVSAPTDRLSGAPFGTSPFTGCRTCTSDKVFDNNTSTYFDAHDAHWAYAGIDLGSGNAKKVTRIRFYPRDGFTKRMTGGRFQGSNTSSSSGFVDLHTINSEPSSNWQEVTISNPNAYRYLRYLAPYESHGNVAEIEFYGIAGTVVDPALREAENPSNTTAGIAYEYYEGIWDQLPDFNSMSAIKKGNSSTFDLSVRNKDDHFGFRYKGYVNVPADGMYTFYILSDDGSKLFIGDREVVNNDAVQSAKEKSGTIGLKAGRHAITVTYFEKAGTKALQVSYAGPGISKTQIPAHLLSRINTTDSPASACSGTGSITREYWANVTGTTVASIPLHTRPTSTSQIYSLESSPNAGDNYGQRIRGYLCAPATGNYTFYIAGDHDNELWLSTDENPSNKQNIASVSHGWTFQKQWNKYSSQTSRTIYLQQGRKYYIEVLHKEDLGDDNLSVGWKLPNSNNIAVIPGSQLAPFTQSSARLASDETEESGNIALRVYPNPAPVGSQLQLEAQALESDEEVQLTVHNNLGKVIYKKLYKTSASGTLKEGIVLEGNLSTGIYFFTLRSKKGVLNQRLMINN